MLPWLDKTDIQAVVGELPESFPYGKLTPLVELTVSGWLTDLLGSVKIAELETAYLTEYVAGSDPLTDEQTEWAKLIRPFLVLAVWSDYLRNSNVSYTKTGPVTKRTDYSDPIEKEQREGLSSTYYYKAKDWAVRISRKASKNTACSRTDAGSKRTSVTVVRGKGKSYFLDGPY